MNFHILHWNFSMTHYKINININNVMIEKYHYDITHFVCGWTRDGGR